MNTKVLALSLMICVISIPTKLLAQRKKLWYTGGEVHLLVMKGGKIEDSKPISSRAIFTYDTFFKTYNLLWLDEDNTMVEMKFKFIEKSNNGSVRVTETTLNEEYYINDSNLESERYITVGKGYRTSINKKVVSEESRYFLVKNLKLDRVEEK